MNVIDLEKRSLRDVNQRLHSLPKDTNERLWKLVNVHGEHACAVGLTQPIEVHIEGHIGYYCAGMNKEATVVIHGQCGVGVGENMMSGEVRVKGTASTAAGAPRSNAQKPPSIMWQPMSPSAPVPKSQYPRHLKGR